MADEYTPIGQEITLPEAPEQGELEKSLLPALSAEKEREVYQDALSSHQEALNDRQEWLDRLVIDEDAYWGRLPEKRFPWEGCSNLNVPLTMLGIETLKPRLIESVMGADPPIFVRPVESTDEEREERTHLFLNWQVQSELDIAPLVAQSAHLFLLPGVVISKQYWKIDQRKSKSIRHYPKDTPLDVVFDDLFATQPPEDFKRILGKQMTWEGEIRSFPGPVQKIRATFKFDEEETQVLVERDERLYDGAAIELLSPEDFIAPAMGGSDLQVFPWIEQRLWLSEYDLIRKIKQGVFDREAVKALLQTRYPGTNLDQDGNVIRESRAETEGVTTAGGSDVRRDQYEVIERYERLDLDSDEIDDECIYWYSPDLAGRLLGYDYLDNVYAHGMRPYAVGRFWPLPFTFYTPSFAYVARNLQEEINAIHNQRVDFGTLQNAPCGTYRASMTQPGVEFRIQPGKFFPSDNPGQDLHALQFNGSPAFGQAEEALLYQYFERLFGITDLSLGRQPSRVGATRTATGTASLLAESGLRFQVAMKSFQRYWMNVLSQVLALDQQYLPDGKEFRVTGRYPEIIKLTNRHDIRGKFDIRLAATSETMNRQTLREDATVRMQLLLNPSLIQTGIVSLKGIYKSVRSTLKAYGETDPDGILEAPHGGLVMTPEEELATIVSGGDVKPSMVVNLGEHIEAHMADLRNPEILRVLGSVGRGKLEKLLSTELQLAQSQAMAMSLQGPNGKRAVMGPQAVNAQIGQTAPQQAPVQTPMPTSPTMG